MRRKQTTQEKIIMSLGEVYDKTKQSIGLTATIIRQQKQKEALGYELQQLKKQLAVTKTKAEHYEDIYGTLTKLKSDMQTSSNTIVDLLKQEIQRLELLAQSQQEAITKLSVDNPVFHVESPSLQKTLHPIQLFKNYKRFQEEKKMYRSVIQKMKSVQTHVVIDKEKNNMKIQTNGTRKYKAENMNVHSGYVKIGDKYVSTYYLSDIPAYLSPYVFFKLLTSSLPFSISIFISPTASSSLIKKARQRLSILEMQQNERINQGKLRDQKIDKSVEEITAFIEELVHETEKGILYSLYLSLEATTSEELKILQKELHNITDAIEFIVTRYTFGQKKAFEAMLPFNTDTIGHNRILQSTAAAYLMPFVTKQIHDPDGIFLGTNAYHDSLVFVNPFTVRNSNINILGVSGAGKSVTAKALATRLYMRGTQVIIIDPEGEYTSFAKALGGEVIQFTRDNGINPFSITEQTKEAILDHISILKTFFKFFIPEKKYDGAILDKSLMQLFEKSNPSFPKFLKLIQKTPMFAYLNVLNEGSLQGIFNSKREIELQNDLIVFDISPFGNTEQKAPAMYLLTSLLWQLVNKKTDRKRMLFIDEAHKLLVDKDVAIFYREMVKQARKRNLGVVSITQDVEDFLHSEFGKAVLTNSETKILLKQSYATLALMGNIFPMTDDEKQQLGNLEIGDFVLFRENEHMRVNLHVLPSEEHYVFPQTTPS